MPHLIDHFTSPALATFGAAGLTIGKFTGEAETIVADIFNTEFDEELVAGENVKTDGTFISETMPTEIHITILAWYTPRRSVLQKDPIQLDKLNKMIERAIRKMMQVMGVPVEDLPWVRVHVVLVVH